MDDGVIKIHRKKLSKLALDTAQSARAVNLVYVSDSLEGISRVRGNTRTVCRKYYIHPAILDGYNENKLAGLLWGDAAVDGIAGLTEDEHVLMKILEMQARVEVG